LPSDKKDGRHSSTDTRFRKGQSGNPKGRPRREPAHPPSAFDVLFDKTITAGDHRLTLEEALQFKTLQKAFAGDPSARRQVLQWIAKREKAREAQRPQLTGLKLEFEHGDPRNVDEAMLILGIATLDNRQDGDTKRQRLLLEPWATQAALRRRRGPAFTKEEISDIRRTTRDADTLRLPKGIIHE
jgi:hypothetical protein